MGTDVPTIVLGAQEGVELGHALIARVAHDAAIRVLFIKGPVVSAQGLRAMRRSADIDVLVDPPKREALISALHSLGWHQRPTSTQGRLLPLHALSLIHDSWPCDIDAHDYYPGFFAEKTAAFEVLWSRRDSVIIAGQQIPCTDRAGSALIIAAHALRDPRAPRSSNELAFLVERVRSTFTPEQLDEVDRLATQVRARESLAPFLKRIGIENGLADLFPDERRRWLMRASDSTRSLGWLVGLQTVSLRSKPKYLFRALIPTEDELRAVHPETEPGWCGLVRGHAKRVIHGFGSIGPAIVSYTTRQREYRKAAER